MKNRLLFSTALVAVLSATNVYAADLSGKVERPERSKDPTTSISEVQPNIPLTMHIANKVVI